MKKDNPDGSYLAEKMRKERRERGGHEARR
jgi:hypothetical protein